MATYKMKSTQKGVKAGEVHPVTFHEGNTYEIDDELAGQFKTLEAIEESSEAPVEPEINPERADIHENWLDTDPAVLRHGELTAQEVVAIDESANPQTTEVIPQVEGKAEGDVDAEHLAESTTEEPEGETKGKKSK